MIIGSPKEIFKGENRVAMTPESAKQLQNLGYKCILESKAGINANFSDKDYKDAGVKIVKNADQLWKESDIILKVRGPEKTELTKVKVNQHIISFIWPGQNKSLLENLKKKMQREGMFREMKNRRAYEKPSERRAREMAESTRRVRKLMRKRLEREGY